MTGRIAEITNNRAAKIAGIAWLLIIVTGVFAEFFVRSSLIVDGDAAETARKIIDSESLFRAGIVSDILMVIFDVTVAIALYVLLKPVNRTLSLLAAAFRLLQASVLAVNLLNLLAVTQLLSGAEYLGAFSPDQLNAMASTFLEAHAVGYSVGLVFFSLSTAVLSYLLFKSKSVPSALAVMLGIASVIYMSGSLIHVLAPDFVDEFDPAYVVPFIAELSVAGWLLFKGARVWSADGGRLASAAAVS